MLNKDLGQHFLIDENILSAIIDAAHIGEQEHVIEIGPGIGVLTTELLKKTQNVTAIEIDESLIPLLQSYCASVLPSYKLEIINDNALEVPFPSQPYKIVANIPYHITSPLLRHAFLESETFPTSMTLLIQKEVAQKICDTKKAGILTVLVNLFGTPHYVTHVAPECFLPPPKVDSAVLHIDCKQELDLDSETIEHVFILTKMAFSQKRKMLSNTLGSLENGIQLLKQSGVDPTRRPETLSVDEWIQLARSYKI